MAECFFVLGPDETLGHLLHGSDLTGHRRARRESSVDRELGSVTRSHVK